MKTENKFPYQRAYVEITNICNRNCSFCPGTKRALKRMSFDEFKTVCEKLKGVTKYLYLHVMGEPLTHPLLSDFICYANSNGYKISITTNGVLLPKVQSTLISAKPYKVNISVHSFESGPREDYIKYLDGCIKFADEASKSGILTILRLWNRGYDEGRNIDTLKILKEYFVGCEWKEGVSGARIRDKLHLDYGDRFDWPDMEKEDMGERVFCHGMQDHFGILCDGTVVPCCLDHEGDIDLGNIFESDIETILNCDRATRIKEGFQNKCAVEELCKKCGYARRFKV